MIVIGLIKEVNTDAELTALTGLLNQEFIFHHGENCAFMFRSNLAAGDFQADDNSGFFIKENLKTYTLEDYKEIRFKEIDERTGELVLQGFSYGGLIFSMSLNAQINIEALNSSRNSPALNYPITYNTLNDLETYDITDATDLNNMYLTALGTKKAVVDSGTNLKQQIRDASTALEVKNIIDIR